MFKPTRKPIIMRPEKGNIWDLQGNIWTPDRRGDNEGAWQEVEERERTPASLRSEPRREGSLFLGHLASYPSVTRRAIASDLVEAAEARLDAFNIDFAEVSADANAKGGREFSKFIALTERPAPLVAVGITSLDLGPQHVRAIAFATESSRDGFRLNFNASADQATHAGAPYPDSDTILRGGKAAWLRALPDDPNIQIGRRSIGDLYPKGSYLYPDNKATIKFPHPFPSQPRVVLWISGMEFSKNNNWRLQASVVNITCDGFTLSAGPWGDSTLYKFDVTWIAHADIPGIQSGVFSTEDVRKTGWALQTAGSTKFTTPFAEQPKVVAALNKFEYGCGRDLTLQTTIKVSAEGLDWSMNSTGDTHQYITSCSYIAFDANLTTKSAAT